LNAQNTSPFYLWRDCSRYLPRISLAEETTAYSLVRSSLSGAYYITNDYLLRSIPLCLSRLPLTPCCSLLCPLVLYFSRVFATLHSVWQDYGLLPVYVLRFIMCGGATHTTRPSAIMSDKTTADSLLRSSLSGGTTLNGLSTSPFSV
jgi:hypothetical protein